MYIGVWPELHLAKLVAAAEASQGRPCSGPRSASSEPPASAGGESIGCETPKSAASLPGLDVLLQAPLCRRVDLHDADAFRGCASSYDIGPQELPHARRGSKNKSSDGTLPPLPAHFKRGVPKKLLRHVPEHGQRARSQPRLFQPPLPDHHSNTSASSCSSTHAKAHRAHHRSASPTATPPHGTSPAPQPANAYPRPPVPEKSMRSATPATPPKPQIVLEASSETESLPAQLTATPPWRRKSRTPPPPPTESGNRPPGWISGIRANVENTRELFLESPSRANKASNEMHTPESEERIPKMRQVPARQAQDEWLAPKPKASMLAVPAHRNSSADSRQRVAEAVNSIEAALVGSGPHPTPLAAPAKPEIRPRSTDQAAVVASPAQPTQVTVPAKSEIRFQITDEVMRRTTASPDVPCEARRYLITTPTQDDDDDDDGDALIAWSQGLCLADFHKCTEPGDALAAVLAEVPL